MELAYSLLGVSWVVARSVKEEFWTWEVFLVLSIIIDNLVLSHGYLLGYMERKEHDSFEGIALSFDNINDM